VDVQRREPDIEARKDNYRSLIGSLQVGTDTGVEVAAIWLGCALGLIDSYKDLAPAARSQQLKLMGWAISEALKLLVHGMPEMS